VCPRVSRYLPALKHIRRARRLEAFSAIPESDDLPGRKSAGRSLARIVPVGVAISDAPFQVPKDILPPKESACDGRLRLLSPLMSPVPHARRLRGLSVSVGQLIRWLLPDGPNRSGAQSEEGWTSPPDWPPDLFCVAATLVEQSGCYIEPGLLFSRDDSERAAKRDLAERAREAGREWRETGTRPAVINALWAKLLAAQTDKVCSGVDQGKMWKPAALQLMAIADEACRDIGFIPDDKPPNEPARIALEVFADVQGPRPRKPPTLHLPASLCFAVPPDVACVLPKSLTPSVGCTLRSLSLNLALLPARGAVGAEWYISTGTASVSDKTAATGEPFNLLLIPFPYEVGASDFSPAGPAAGGGADGYFCLQQGWLPDGPTRDNKVADFVSALVQQAQLEGEIVHGIIFPETALAAGMASNLASKLAGKFPMVELLVCGTLSSNGEMGQNEAAVVLIEKGKEMATLVQKKHHRWCLTPSQIRQYRLERSLPNDNYWERIDVSERMIQFGVNRRNAVVAALICEDLARFDPVLPIINAVGPNLVVALLMDGPQLQARWPGKYATVLADDPGSSVLTLTSLGMLKRCRRPHESVNRCVALWKDRTGDAKELMLPDGSHALLLSIATSRISQKTLDLRHEDGTVAYTFAGVRDVSLPASPAFSWLARSAGNA